MRCLERERLRETLHKRVESMNGYIFWHWGKAVIVEAAVLVRVTPWTDVVIIVGAEPWQEG